MNRTSALVLAGALALGGMGLAACSSSESTPAESSSASIVGNDPATWSPIQISQDANGTTIDLVAGQAAVFTDFPEGGAVVESSDPAVVTASQAGSDGDATFTAGLQAQAPGSATITVLYPDEPADQGGASNIVMQFEVNVSAS